MTQLQAPYITENTPVEEIEALLPADELDELSAIGDMRDDQRWKLGDKAREWIDERNLPVGQICKIIGKRADYGHERIRQFLYCSRFYYERPELRDKYLNLRYSIFEYARGCSDPEAVLKAAFENRLTPGQVKSNYLQVMDEFKELMTRVPKVLEEEAKDILKTAIAKIRELVDR
jgi:hypothetical protein